MMRIESFQFRLRSTELHDSLRYEETDTRTTVRQWHQSTIWRLTRDLFRLSAGIACRWRSLIRFRGRAE